MTFSAFIVHNAQIEAAVFDVAVTRSTLPESETDHIAVLTLHGRQVAAAREVQLIVDRRKVGYAQFFDHVVEDLLHGAHQSAEQVLETRGFCSPGAQFLRDILPYRSRQALRTAG